MFNTIFKKLKDKKYYRQSKVNKILKSEKIDIVSNSLDAVIEKYLDFSDTTKLIEYVKYISSKIYAILEASKEFSDKNNLLEFMDIQNTILAEALKQYNNEAAIDVTIDYVISEYLNFMYDSDTIYFRVFALTIYNNNGHLTCVNIEPICYNYTDRMDNYDSALQFANEIINIFEYLSPNSYDKNVFINVITSKLWIKDYNKVTCVSTIVEALNKMQTSLFNYRLSCLLAKKDEFIAKSNFNSDIGDIIDEYQNNINKYINVNDKQNIDFIEDNENIKFIGEQSEEVQNDEFLLKTAKYYSEITDFLFSEINDLQAEIKQDDISSENSIYSRFPLIKKTVTDDKIKYAPHIAEDFKTIYKYKINAEKNSIDKIKAKEIDNKIVINKYSILTPDSDGIKTYSIANDFKNYLIEISKIVLKKHNNIISSKDIRSIATSYKNKNTKISKVIKKENECKIYSKINNKQILFTFDENCDTIKQIEIKEK